MRPRPEYRELLDRAETVEDILAIQNQLFAVRGEIEAYEAQLEYYTDQVDLATLTVSIIPTPEPVEQATEDFDPAVIVEEAVASLVSFGQWLVSAGIWLLIVGIPALIVFGIVAFVAWKIFRRVRPARPPQPPQAPATRAQPRLPPTVPDQRQTDSARLVHGDGRAPSCLLKPAAIPGRSASPRRVYWALLRICAYPMLRPWTKSKPCRPTSCGPWPIRAGSRSSTDWPMARSKWERWPPSWASASPTPRSTSPSCVQLAWSRRSGLAERSDTGSATRT